MSAEILAQQIKSNLQGATDAGDARKKLWDTVKSYIETNARVTYSWAAVNSVTQPPTPDPILTFPNLPISTSQDPGLESIVPESTWKRVTKAEEAMTLLSGAMNSCASTWLVQFPATLLVNPALVIPAIVLAPSGLRDGDAAMVMLCNQILSGLISCTPIISGTNNGVYVGAGSFTNLMIV